MKSRAIAGTLLGILALAASDARADGPTKEHCASANESAQSSRKDGKLRAARAHLLICVAKSCPQVVRDDCAERLNDLDAAMPSIVFTVKGTNNADVAGVKVTMDGAPLVDRLDGNAINVDPGTHTFELRADGYPPAVTKLVIREGAKRRQEVITFIVPPARPVAAAAPSAPGASAPRAPGRPDGASERPANEPAGGTQRTMAIVLGSAGLIGLGLGTYFGLRASSTYHDASARCPTSSSCDDEGVAGGKDAHSQATIATVALVAGGALLASGIIVYLTAPRQGSVSLQPVAGAGMAGLRVGGAW